MNVRDRRARIISGHTSLSEAQEFMDMVDRLIEASRRAHETMEHVRLRGCFPGGTMTCELCDALREWEGLLPTFAEVRGILRSDDKATTDEP